MDAASRIHTTHAKYLKSVVSIHGTQTLGTATTTSSWVGRRRTCATGPTCEMMYDIAPSYYIQMHPYLGKNTMFLKAHTTHHMLNEITHPVGSPQMLIRSSNANGHSMKLWTCRMSSCTAILSFVPLASLLHRVLPLYFIGV